MNCPSHTAFSSLLHFWEDKIIAAGSSVPMKVSEWFLSPSHLCSHLHSHSHSHLGLCLCLYIWQQKGAITVPKGYWQSLANVQPATFWRPVLLPDTSDPYSLLRHRLRTLRSASGMIMVEDQKNHQLQFWHWRVWPYLNLCLAWRSASQSHAVPNLCRGQSLQEGRAGPAVKK